MRALSRVSMENINPYSARLHTRLFSFIHLRDSGNIILRIPFLSPPLKVFSFSIFNPTVRNVFMREWENRTTQTELRRDKRQRRHSFATCFSFRLPKGRIFRLIKHDRFISLRINLIYLIKKKKKERFSSFARMMFEPDAASHVKHYEFSRCAAPSPFSSSHSSRARMMKI